MLAVRPETVASKQLFDHYIKTHSNGTIEDNSLKTLRTHFSQLTETLGERFRIQSLTLQDLQGHV